MRGPGRWPGPLWWLTHALTRCPSTHIPRHGHLTHPVPPAANLHRLLPPSLHPLSFSSLNLYIVLRVVLWLAAPHLPQVLQKLHHFPERWWRRLFPLSLLPAPLCPLCPWPVPPEAQDRSYRAGLGAPARYKVCHYLCPESRGDFTDTAVSSGNRHHPTMSSPTLHGSSMIFPASHFSM